MGQHTEITRQWILFHPIQEGGSELPCGPKARLGVGEWGVGELTFWGWLNANSTWGHYFPAYTLQNPLSEKWQNDGDKMRVKGKQVSWLN
jgi:hypothetical protein